MSRFWRDVLNELTDPTGERRRTQTIVDDLRRDKESLSRQLGQKISEVRTRDGDLAVLRRQIRKLESDIKVYRRHEEGCGQCSTVENVSSKKAGPSL